MSGFTFLEAGGRGQNPVCLVTFYAPFIYTPGPSQQRPILVVSAKAVAQPLLLVLLHCFQSHAYFPPTFSLSMQPLFSLL